MAAPQPRVRIAALIAPVSLVLALGCYSTTPHRVQIASKATPKDCANAISDVFTRSGFIQLPTPPKVTMFFAARMGGPYSSFLSTGSGVGVTLHHEQSDESICHVTLEALSPDVGCPGSETGSSGTLSCRRPGAPGRPGGLARNGASDEALCPLVPGPLCEMSYAPGEDNDAAVDELARRLQAALGPSGRVN